LDQRISNFVKGKILFNDDDSVDAVAEYDGVVDGDLWEVDAKIGSNHKVEEITVDQIKYANKPIDEGALLSLTDKVEKLTIPMTSLSSEDIKTP
jgi:hypothetical protein